MKHVLLAFVVAALATPVGLAAATGDRPAAPAAAAADPCETRVENHQFDFWIGRWDVYSGDEKVAESTIERLAGSCAILESYVQADGYTGKSINFYDAVLRKWRQTWVDRAGTVSEFSGALRDGAMWLEGRTHTRDGREILRTMRVSVAGDGRVRQYSERSNDGGTSWTVAYDYTYRKKDLLPPSAGTR